MGELDEEQIKSVLRYPVLMVSLWVNQRDGLNEWLDKGREGILEMATATGKTVAGIAAIAHLCGELPDHSQHQPQTDDADILVVAHSNAILSQWKRELSEKLGLPHGVLHGDAQPNDLHFSTGTVQFQTVHSLLPHYDPDLKSHYDLVIVDEVHHYSNEEGFGQAVKRPNYDAVLGLSATIGDDENDPLRKTIQNIVAPIVYTFDLEDAVEWEIIPDFEWKVHPTPLDPDEREE
ncbi:MAG: DNA or RNA helicase of superfamily II [Haloquadratum sp. J07HQX50]|nr:MAG: DNA or RNA helicase of superfamily II [Haloquadratum sp. J07HQX50]